MAHQDVKCAIEILRGTAFLLVLLIVTSHFATVDTKRGGSSGGRGGSSSSSGRGRSSSVSGGHSSSSSGTGCNKHYGPLEWWEITYVEDLLKS